uniref:Uncharacterized protein n=1 Tax=Arundo donax TaxID=35708 RepID=A0A0A9B2Q6_ARUDO
MSKCIKFRISKSKIYVPTQISLCFSQTEYCLC